VLHVHAAIRKLVNSSIKTLEVLMPVATVQEFVVAEGERSTTNHDAIKAELNAKADPPAGMVFHTAGFKYRATRPPK
jgi:hypothetical protein